MKKSLMALAVIGALSASLSARADTTLQIYGHVDLSIDNVNNGLSGRAGVDPNEKAGSMTQLSSNLSRVGLRADRDIGDGLKALMQVETQIDVSANPGTSSDNQVKGAFASRNSFIGLAGGWGAFKAGKTDAPYKLSTGRMDPFSATVGDYNSIIGNSGGDNRAEFDLRLSHAIWYESPNMNGLRINALYSPGQNRAEDNSVQAAGEPNCTGGNLPPCGDGAFGDAFSIAADYSAGPLYGVLAYENHSKVNRTGDEAGPAGGLPGPGQVGVADEHAMKIGVQYKFASKTTVNFIYEDLNRAAPVDIYNERSHKATWLALTQKISPEDDVNFGWAHAGKTPGDPGAALQPGNGLTPVAGPVDNAGNLYDIGYKHHFADKKTTWYLVYARQANHAGAHYDLGASGHGLTVDCHDIAGNCFSGTTLQALSAGFTFDF
jgi:predicted porin